MQEIFYTLYVPERMKCLFCSVLFIRIINLYCFSQYQEIFVKYILIVDLYTLLVGSFISTYLPIMLLEYIQSAFVTKALRQLLHINRVSIYHFFCAQFVHLLLVFFFIQCICRYTVFVIVNTKLMPV